MSSNRTEELKKSIDSPQMEVTPESTTADNTESIASINENVNLKSVIEDNSESIAPTKEYLNPDSTIENNHNESVTSTNENLKPELTNEDTAESVDKTVCDNKAPAKTENDAQHNPYAYLDRGEFTSEKFKIEIKGLPRYYGLGEFKKLLNNKLKLASNKIKAPGKGSKWAYVCFRSEEEKLHAVNVLNGYQWKGRKLSVNDALPAPDPLVKKRKQDAANTNNDTNKKARIIENPVEDQERRLKDSTIPYWDVPYEQQLKLKRESMITVLKQMADKLLESNSSLEPWLTKQRALYEGAPCELIDVRSAVPIDGYRNKCEFTVGINELTEKPTVGFRLGRYTAGVTAVASPESLRHVSDSMKEAARVFEQFVQASDLVPFDPETRTGFFHHLTVRQNASRDQLMLVATVNEKDVTTERLEEFKRQLVDYFVNGSGTSIGVTSLYYRRWKEVENALVLLHGEPHIRETLLGLEFRISPSAFFQINTAAAEVLYRSAIELAAPTPNSTVVDVCCGTGTIGLCFARSCAQVLGLELDARAIEDAKKNAEYNGLKNCEFFPGAAERMLFSLLHRATGDQVIAVVDPPRAGLHQSAIKQLRGMKRLDKIVFVACDAAAAMKNFIDLGRAKSKMMRSEPFIPTKALIVDLFPHTKHCELLICFERYSKEKIEDAVTSTS